MFSWALTKAKLLIWTQPRKGRFTSAMASSTSVMRRVKEKTWREWSLALPEPNMEAEAMVKNPPIVRTPQKMAGSRYLLWSRRVWRCSVSALSSEMAWSSAMISEGVADLTDIKVFHIA